MIAINPTQKSPERAFALQKYLLLHSQHDALQKHLTRISTSLPTTASPSPSSSPDRFREDSISSSSGSEDSSAPSPPQLRPHQRSGSIPAPNPQRPVLRTRRSSLPNAITENLLEEIEEDESKLKDVNQQIKSTLTTLLNCESVRADRRYSNWVQTRLMDAERELKKNRSRSCSRSKSEDANGMTI